jgi:hypothetical protein
MDLSGKLHAPAALTPEEKHGTPGLFAGSEEERNLLLVSAFEPRTVQAVADYATPPPDRTLRQVQEDVPLWAVLKPPVPLWRDVAKSACEIHRKASKIHE